jgi:hypothetical protein
MSSSREVLKNLQVSDYLLRGQQGGLPIMVAAEWRIAFWYGCVLNFLSALFPLKNQISPTLPAFGKQKRIDTCLFLNFFPRIYFRK